MSTSVKMTALSPGGRPQLREGVRLHRDRLSGQPVLLFPEGILLLNDTAATVLKLCDGQRPIREIVAALSASYGVSHDVVSRDVAECLVNLRDRALLRMASEETA